VAYKANIDDVRESPAIKIAELLREKEADIVYHDPFVEKFTAGGETVSLVELTADEVAAADAVLIVTDHRDVDYDVVVEHAQLVLDTRNVLKGIHNDRVVRL
jgi:UDP-N-acetyl-D-glucosamine dehydrogenase